MLSKQIPKFMKIWRNFWLAKKWRKFHSKNSLKTHQKSPKRGKFYEDNEDLNATFNCKFMDFLTNNQLKWKWIATFEFVIEELGSDAKLLFI
jgi:hypothetical protein